MADLPPPAPPAASARRYLRGGLPAVYADDELAMRFLEELERTLDAVVALLDSLPAHLDPALAPDDLLELMGAWLGVDVDQVVSEDGEVADLARRALVVGAAQLTRSRGTLAGLNAELQLAFPGLDIEVSDSGGVTQGSLHEAVPPAAEPSFEVVVGNPEAVTAQVAGLLRRAARRGAPVHLRGHLRLGREAEAVPI